MGQEGGNFLLQKFFKIISKHIKGNIIIYFFVCLFFMIGISAGVFTIKALSPYQKQELISYMRNFFQILQNSSVDEFSVLKQSLVNNLQTCIFIWLLGITIIGFPIILILVAIRGLIIGFTVGFFIEQMGWRGILFALLSILPQNLFIIPSILAISVIGISFSIMLIKNKFQKHYHYHQISIFRQFIFYSSIIFCILIVIVVGCLIEAYITPVFMKIISKYMY